MARILLAPVLGLALAGLGALPAAALPESCAEGQKLIEDRQKGIEAVNALPKKNADPAKACTIFTNLSGAHAKLAKWTADNKDWCQIPDQFSEGLKTSGAQISKVRANACSVAAKVNQMKREAAAQAAKARQGGVPGGVPSGDVLNQPIRMPQGVL